MTGLINNDARRIANAPLNWDRLCGKTVLIAGANGYVPQFFVHGLLARNDLFDSHIKVIALCRNMQRAAKRFSQYEGRKDFELLIQDVTEPVRYEGGIAFIIHAASTASIKERYQKLTEVFDANVTGCKMLLELAVRKKSEMLFLSSVDVYGDCGGQRLREGVSGALDPLNLRNVYSCAKRAAETLCACYAAKGVSCKIARPFQILGGGVALDDGRLHADFISQMINGDVITLKGDGAPRRTFLYVTDAISGMLTILLDGKSGEAYNVVSESGEASVLELAELMASLVKGRKIKIEYNMETRKNDPAVTRALSVVCGDSAKIRKLGWTPEVTLEEACTKLLAYYGL